MGKGFDPQHRARASMLAVTDEAETNPVQGRVPAARLRVPGAWPLLVVLIVQAVLSARLLRADTAFQDEAAYLWAGHLEWASLLHGTSIPPFASYFSGAPVIYPPIAALADSIGGLTAARILSLAFMLGATALLWSATAKLFGRRAAFFGAALFAVLGPTLHLGAFATYDAMSVFLIALAAWLVVRAGARPDATRWLVAAGVVLAVANATAYSTILADLVVILLALLIALPDLGAKLAAARCLTVLIVAAVLLGLGCLLGGGSYVNGFEITTLDRAQGSASASTVLADAWSWTGVIVVAAACAFVISAVRRDGAARTVLVAILAASALLGPFEQAYLHTTASLDKHVGLGAWFAAIAAGYAVDRLIAAASDQKAQAITAGACVVALALPISLGVSQSWQFSSSWPKSSGFVAILRPLVEHGNGRLLVEDPSIAEYYLKAESQWMRWSSTRNIVLPSGASSGGPSTSAGIVGAGNAGTFGTKIEEGYFSLVALNFADTTALDKQIAADLALNPHYKKILVVPYGTAPGTYVIWQYEPNR
jgi:Dolichyl-phosphate-mannose-protein mannosyltransferase